MRCVLTGLALLAGVLALSLGEMSPARAEFFGCQDQRGQVLYTYNGTPGQFHDRYSQNTAGQSRPRYSHSQTTDYDSRRYWSDRSRY